MLKQILLHNKVKATERQPTLFVRVALMLLPIFTKVHIALYRRTDGAVGGRIGETPVLLLTTTGRKTGQQRTTPLAYIADGDTLVIIGGAAASPRHPAWWLNLRANPMAQVQIRQRFLNMRAVEATPEEEQDILSRHPAQRALLDAMQRTMARKIPAGRNYQIEETRTKEEQTTSVVLTHFPAA